MIATMQETDVNGETVTTHAEGGMATGSPSDSTASPNLNTPEAPKPPTKRMLKMAKKQGKQYKKLFARFQKTQEAKKEALAERLFKLKQQIGKEEFKLLKSLSTAEIPEVKNEAGEVTRPKSFHVNYDMMFAEAKNLTVLMRQRRLESGERKRTTGRSSKRKAHKSRLAAVVARNKRLEEAGNALANAQAPKQDEKA
jgi:hypothetical protein